MKQNLKFSSLFKLFLLFSRLVAEFLLAGLLTPMFCRGLMRPTTSSGTSTERLFAVLPEYYCYRYPEGRCEKRGPFSRIVEAWAPSACVELFYGACSCFLEAMANPEPSLGLCSTALLSGLVSNLMKFDWFAF